MYKKLFIVLIIALPFIMSACKKDATSDCNTTGVPNEKELATIQTYLTANSLAATKDPGGFFYQITNSGTGATPNVASKVTVQYTGKLFDGSIFDSNTTPAGVTFNLSGLIKGWQLGIPLVQKGGSIILYLPPSLAYGCNAAGSIPGNTPLIFEINLLDVQ
jgi:FKBP-type peptidyl-prolyl cis-trans isomerase